jgi:hypothetical protein
VGTLHNKKTPAIQGRGLGGWAVGNSQAGLTGLEPATSGVTDRHSNQLSYSPKPLAERRNIDACSGQFNGRYSGGLHLYAACTDCFAFSYCPTNPNI